MENLMGMCSGSVGSTSVDNIKLNLDLLAQTGLPIYVSEFEAESANENEQLENMKEVFPIIWEHSAVGRSYHMGIY